MPFRSAQDINPHAVAAARRTFEANELPVDLVRANLCAPFKLLNRVDVMLFNPVRVVAVKLFGVPQSAARAAACSANRCQCENKPRG